MFNFDILNTPQPLNMFLCKPNLEILYQLNGIDDDTASVTINLNNQYELYFDYLRYVNSQTGNMVESNGYHNLVVGMVIYVEKIGFFRIKYPPMKFDGEKEIKSVTASSIDSELEDKDLVNFKINTGEKDSLEYLVEYEDGETESLLNAYTDLPYDYIVFYNTYPEQLQKLYGRYQNRTYTNSDIIDDIQSYCKLIPRLIRKVNTDNNGNTTVTEYVTYTYDSSGKNVISVKLTNFNNRIQELITYYTKYREQLSLIHLAIEKCNCNWTIGEIDESLCNKKYQFDVNGENIYSFLTKDIAEATKSVIQFDLFNKTINVRLIENIGKQSGVIIDKYNLLNSLEVNCDSDKIYTRYNVSGGNKVDVTFVNFGNTRIEDLTYFMNARNEQNKRIYVSDELAEKYQQYVDDKEIAREAYINLTTSYNQALIDIDEIKYRVPNDSVSNEWDTFSNEELNNMLVVYNQLLATLQTLYKEDYGSVGLNNDGSINENYIKNTEYWFDYYAYKQTIDQIEEAIHARANGKRYADIDNATILKKINAYKTEWSLYGTVELENKITAYNNAMQVLVDGEAVLKKNNSDEAKPWSSLTNAQKIEYGNLESNYQYDAYMQNYNERQECQSYLNTLYSKLSIIENNQKSAATNRTKLVKLIQLENYNHKELAKIITLDNPNENISFSQDDIKAINVLYIDNDYTNDYILTTSLDNAVSEIDVQKELLEDAQEQLSIESQPQISFESDIENLLAMKDFEGFDFYVGNFVTIEYYDDYYVDLRLASMTFNPCVPDYSLTVSFTNFTNSKSERSDVTNILGLAVGGNGSGGSGSSGGSGNKAFGEDDKIDVTISNTMLSKLLNTEMFGTRVSNIILDTIKVNEIQAKYAKFEGLAKGTTIIDGKCITTGYIIDQYYDGTNGNINNSNGSVINLETGKFSFGGGRLKWDGTTLSVNGHIEADSGKIGGLNGFTITSGAIYSGSHSYYNRNNDGIYIGTDYIGLGSGGQIYFSSSGMGRIGNWYINANSIYSSGASYGSSGMYFGTSGLSISNKFKVSSSGYLTATGVEITGEISASSGSIGGWDIESGSLYRGSDSFGSSAGMYMGSSGLSVTNKFKVESNGKFNFGNGAIVFDGSTLTFGNNVSITWSTISNKPTILTRSDVVSITQDTINAPYINSLNITATNIKANATISSPTISGGTINIANNFIVDYQGNLEAKNEAKFGTSGGGYTHIYYNSIKTDMIESTTDLDLYARSGRAICTNSPFHMDSSNNGLYGGSLGFGSAGASGSYYVSEYGNGHFDGLYSSSGSVGKSDKKAKNHIMELSDVDGLEDFFMRLKPSAYTMKQNDSHRVHLGLYAQDVSKAAYDTIGDVSLYQALRKEHGDSDKEYAGQPFDPTLPDEELEWFINYDGFIAPLVAMVQKQNREIKELQSQLQQLEV